jgi:hypothetical protein
MPVVDADFISRKEKAIVEDLKTAFSGYERLVRQVNEIRRWIVTIQVAALGLLLSGALQRASVVLFPATLALVAFMLLELRERSSMRFNKKEVLTIEEILMLKNRAEYNKSVEEYRFRDLRLAKLDRALKLTHLVASLFDLSVVLWYGFWAALIGIAFYAFS